MILTSKELFETFAEYCTAQTELSHVSTTVTPSASSLTLSNQPIIDNSQNAANTNTTANNTTSNSSSTANITSSTANTTINTTTDTITATTTDNTTDTTTTLIPIVRTKPTLTKHNYAGLLQRVIMLLQENSRKVQSAEKLHDIAIILDRCKRQNRIDSINISALFECIKLMIIGLEAYEEKKFRVLDDEYSQIYGYPKQPFIKSTISTTNMIRTKPKSTLMKRKAGILGMGVSKSIPKPPPKRVKKQQINEDSDTNSDSGESEEEDDHMGRSQRHRHGESVKKRVRSCEVRRYREVEEEEELGDMDDQMIYNGSKDKAQERLESMLSDALQKLRKVDVNRWYHTEVSHPTLPCWHYLVNTTLLTLPCWHYLAGTTLLALPC